MVPLFSTHDANTTAGQSAAVRTSGAPVKAIDRAGNPMDRKARKIQAERDQAYQRLQLAYQEMQVAGEVIKKYAQFSAEREAPKFRSGESIYRRALDAWDAATRDFTEATRDFMAATELLDSLGSS